MISRACSTQAADFYPRPPRGGRPVSAGALVLAEPISIHALREEGDGKKHTFPDDFALFLSTPSARRATLQKYKAGHIFDISIHALREEGDDFPKGGKLLHPYFYPRPPRGGRLVDRPGGVPGE